MQVIQLGTSPLLGSRLAYGCWRLAGTWNSAEVTADARAAGRQAVLAAYEAGYTLFDHADIYCDGEAESIFGQVLKEVSGMRERILIASKCGIRKAGDPDAAAPYRYDFSRQHIVWSCEQSLRRLGVETIDLYQLHRPDYLADFEEVAAAFAELKQQGKVRAFGVSNFSPAQLTALQKVCPFPLVVNQVEISLARLAPFEDGTLDQCQAEHITPLAWSPLAGGLLGDGAHRLLPAQQAYQPAPILTVVDELARAHGVSRVVIALAWLLRHPAGIVPIIGSIRPERIREAVRATQINLSREEWYRLFSAARKERLP
ncbi:aldo/keto reductase [Fontisphaera persica]|uniref:aldo/keto reductase n=1 Tax=Fontisphaera persica TaxID=2974023 RepID=UPI0024C01D68|nr:aldo/keto reductase [Fontisphaera persica]WCJ58514.1 aldo/keto reductase [Fontisphaera persica]